MAHERVVADRPACAGVGELLYGVAPRPVTCADGVVIGGGQVLPEVNFTLPPMLVRGETLEAVRQRYREMVGRVLERAAELGQEALVLEFEQLFEMTRNPAWGASICADIKEQCQLARDKSGVRAALRVTVADIRDEERPPKMRTGEPLGRMLEAFDQCAVAGGDILSIESTGGKEISDQALMMCDIDGLAFALGVLAPRDMAHLWGEIVAVARRRGVVPGGDTACGFGNTAMQLAHQRLIPKVVAAVVRLMTVPRSLVAVEMGAVGPLKDCGYENPAIKALCGVPISMEGKSSACAHSSPVGNVAMAACDLWSNESVQDVRLLGGFAPESFAELLIYDCRLFNEATARGQAKLLRDLHVATDVDRDPQALVLDPAVMHEAAVRLADIGPDDYARTVALAQLAVNTIDEALTEGRLTLDPREEKYLNLVRASVAALPDQPDELAARVEAMYPNLYLPAEYGL